MSDIAIRVENLSKRYVIGRAGARHDTLRDALAGMFRREGGGRGEAFWALRDVSFEVKRGEVVGVIGRNGAGKSTLLKILSQITEPTGGRAEIHGRVGSLLEVGTGFHPELTGRENIYLNGAILGMSREEINRKFDEIVDFAEIEKFIDTPVKHYSSGMGLRLGFAVAAHLEPEILVVDEVLAVGDADFQKKCLGKMSDVAGEGRTVLFVSHNMAAVQSLCKRGIILQSGSLAMSGSVETTVSHYLSTFRAGSQLQKNGQRNIQEGAVAWYQGAIFRSGSDEAVTSFYAGQPIDIILSYKTSQPDLKLDFSIGIYNHLGEKLMHLSTRYTGPSFVCSFAGTLICHIPKLPLPPGSYFVNLSMHHFRERIDHIPNALAFDVIEGDFFGTGKLPPASENKILVEHIWRTTE